EALRKVPGNADVRVEAQTGQPELVVRVRREDADRFGLKNTQILDALHAAYQGAEVGQVFDRNRVLSLVVVLDPRRRGDPSRIAELPIWPASVALGPLEEGQERRATDNGQRTRSQIRLGQVADVYLSDGRFLVAHEGGLRRQLVTCNVKGRDVESF